MELWEQAGLLEAAGRELCRRAAEVLARFCAQLARDAGARDAGARERPSIEVIMVDFTGRTEIARATEAAR
jgi:hypothetical protein